MSGEFEAVAEAKEIFASDKPIKTRGEDDLGRKPFAEKLAKEIKLRKQPDSLVIGLYGEWGSGKSSILNMVAEAIKDPSLLPSPHPIVIQFNPWLYFDHTSLAREFFESIAFEFGRTHETKPLKDIQGAVDALASLSNYAPESSPIPKPALRYGFLGIGRLIACFRAAKEDVVQVREKSRRLLLDNEQPLLIIIDDIDRLTSNEILLTFQLVKSLADFPYTTYLLAFDDVVVAKALDGPTCDSGKDFIEKIVQVPITIPDTPQGKIRSYISRYLDEMIKSSSPEVWDDSYWRTVEHEGFWKRFCTLRIAKRYINTLSLVSARLKNECNLVDLWLIVQIQMFYPNLYRQLPRAKGFLTQDISETLYQHPEQKHRKEEANRRLNELLSHVPDDCRIEVKSMLEFMFPEMGRLATESPIFNSAPEALKKKRVCASENFHRFFLYDLPVDEVSTEVHKFINLENVDDSYNFVMSLDERREDLFVRTEELLPEIEPTRAKVILAMLLRKSDRFQGEPGILGGIGSTIYRIARKILQTKVDSTERMHELNRPFASHEHGLILLELLHVTFMSEHDQNNLEYIMNTAKRTLQKEETEALQLQLEKAFEIEFTTGNIDNHKHLRKLSFQWFYHYGGKEKAVKAMQRICAEDSRLLKFLHDSSVYTLQWKNVFVFFEPSKLSTRLEKVRLDLGSDPESIRERAFVDSWLKFIRDYAMEEEASRSKAQTEQEQPATT